MKTSCDGIQTHKDSWQIVSTVCVNPSSPLVSEVQLDGAGGGSLWAIV